MGNIQKLILTAIYMLLVACGSSGSGDPADPADPGGNPPSNNTGGNTGGTYESSYCVSDDIVTQSDDVFVSFNAFAIAPDEPAIVENVDRSNLEELADALLYSGLLLSVSQADFAIGFGPLFATGLCDAESTQNNQCDTVIPPINGEGGINAVGSVTQGTLTFDVFINTGQNGIIDFKSSTFSGDVFPYWEGSYRLYQSAGDAEDEVTLISWRRDASTEYYSQTAENGDFTNITEQSDCSGTISRQKTNLNNGDITTFDGSWQISGTTTTGEVTQCTNSVCNNLVW